LRLLNLFSDVVSIAVGNLTIRSMDSIRIRVLSGVGEEGILEISRTTFFISLHALKRIVWRIERMATDPVCYMVVDEDESGSAGPGTRGRNSISAPIFAGRGLTRTRNGTGSWHDRWTLVRTSVAKCPFLTFLILEPGNT